MDYIVEHRSVQFRIVETREQAVKAERGYLMAVECMFSEADIINDNDRLYPFDVLDPQVCQFNERLEVGDGLGQANHPKEDEPADVMLQAILWTATEMRGREAWGTARVLNTPAGAVVAGIIEGGARLALSTRARGTTTIATMDCDNPFFEHNQEHEGEEYAQINPTLGLETIDVVVNPGFRNANVRAYERMMESVRTTATKMVRGEADDEPGKATMDFEKMLAEAKAEAEKLTATIGERDAEIVTLKEAADAKATELSETFDAKLAEVKQELTLSDEDRKTLDRVKALDNDKLDTLLNLAEGKEPDNKDKKDDEPTEQDRKILALETKLAASEEKSKLHEQKLQEEIEGRKAEAEVKKLDEHIATVTKGVPNADGIAKWLRDHCDTPEEVDKEFEALKEQVGLKEVLKGIEDTGGDPKGADVANAGSYARPTQDGDAAVLLESAKDHQQSLMGGKRKPRTAEGGAN